MDIILEVFQMWEDQKVFKHVQNYGNLFFVRKNPEVADIYHMLLYKQIYFRGRGAEKCIRLSPKNVQ